jgi:hypothetical protein
MILVQKLFSSFFLFTVINSSIFSQESGYGIGVGVSRNVNLNAYSVSGYQAVTAADGRSFPLVTLYYFIKAKNNVVNNFRLSSHTTGHVFRLKEKLFANSSFKYRASYFSITGGYLREWPILKKVAGYDKLFLGIGCNLNVRVKEKFLYGNDSAVSTTGNKFYAKPPQGGISSINKKMLNGVLGIRYQCKGDKNKRFGTFSIAGEFHWAFAKTYTVIYPYSYENIDDNLNVTNRGHIFSLSVLIPFGQTIKQ